VQENVFIMTLHLLKINIFPGPVIRKKERIVTDSEEGVCVDPGERDAILGTGGPGPPGKGEEQQLLPDSGGGET
jgi:hypothetical protein